jgi:hypothetical protein
LRREPLKVEELQTRYRLLPEVVGILELVQQVSEKDIDFRPVRKLNVAATTKVARQRMPQHIISFDRGKADRINYIIAHECGHILRMLQLPPADRLVPATTSATVSIAAEVLADEVTFLPPALIPKMLDVWVGGLVLQVTNQPVDVKIEQWLYSNYPGLRREQVQGLEKDARVALKALAIEVERMAPPTVFRISNAMNYAYLNHINKITGRNYRNRFRGRQEIIGLGKQLYEISEGEWSDVEVANQWAEHLGIRQWFSWIGFEDMPESYYRD